MGFEFQPLCLMPGSRQKPRPLSQLPCPHSQAVQSQTHPELPSLSPKMAPVTQAPARQPRRLPHLNHKCSQLPLESFCDMPPPHPVQGQGSRELSSTCVTASPVVPSKPSSTERLKKCSWSIKQLNTTARPSPTLLKGSLWPEE